MTRKAIAAVFEEVTCPTQVRPFPVAPTATKAELHRDVASAALSMKLLTTPPPEPFAGRDVYPTRTFADASFPDWVQFV